MQVLFATTNPAKVKKYAERLKEKNIEEMFRASEVAARALYS